MLLLLHSEIVEFFDVIKFVLASQLKVTFIAEQINSGIVQGSSIFLEIS